jgi:hypothetical protein
MLGTSYFLVATSQVQPDYAGEHCYHVGETLTYQVTGTCGSPGVITVTSPADECAIAVRGAGAVGLPSAGRFSASADGTVSLAKSSWTLSGYLPEGVGGAGSPVQPDAGPFMVVRDAQAATDLGPGGSGAGGQTTVAGQHAKPVLRDCSYQPSISATLLSCTGDGLSSCQATLTRQ